MRLRDSSNALLDTLWDNRHQQEGSSAAYDQAASSKERGPDIRPPFLLSEFAGGYLKISISGVTFRKTGANTSETIAISLSRIFKDGPEVSLKGSPTKSPSTAAL